MPRVFLPPQRQMPFPRTGQPDKARGAAHSKSPLPLIICLAVVLPYSAALFIGDIKLTPIKILLLLLTGPAIAKMLSGDRRQPRQLMASDLFALVTALLLLFMPLIVSGSKTLTSSVSQTLEFFGSYIIGRAYFFTNDSIRDLARALKVVTLFVVGMGLLDIITQHFLIHEFVASIFPVDEQIVVSSDPHFHRLILGMDSLRAASTFDHPILFGSFCAILIPIHLYAHEDATSRLFYALVSAVGCVIALSSAPLLALAATIAIYCYDAMMRGARWRWKLLIFTILFGVAALFVLSDNPLSWLFRNLTLDPQTSYYRLLIWNAAIDQISNNFWLGVGTSPTGNAILDSSVDSLWLAKAIVYGVPMIVTLFLTGLAAVVPFRGQAKVRRSDPFLDRMSTAFSLMTTILFFISMTVYFWNAVWLFASLCIGIRVSLKERCLLAMRQHRHFK